MSHLTQIVLLWMCFFWINSGLAQAQIYRDYVGAGHDNLLRVSGSPHVGAHSAQVTVDGNGLDSAYMKVQASRFLAQATLGANRSLIDAVAKMGFAKWIDQQLKVPPSSLQTELENTLEAYYAFCLASGGNEDMCYELAGEYGFMFQAGWWQVAMTGQDLLRQRVALALSEIFVVSGIGQFEEPFAYELCNYYDMLLRNSFGRYEDLLWDVTMHPVMGQYLSHLNNPKTDLQANTRPDENYAREVMQLFSIGLFELNLDGTLKKDAQGNLIPTYNNDDIKEFAKVFTGLGDGAEDGTFGSPPTAFDIDFLVPMRMYEEHHEPGPKNLLNGFVVPAGQSGLQDIRMAVKHLSEHANTAPFISYRLIQRLVKSNPSPAYVRRVSEVFSNNGQGVRGDLGAVVRAILLDPEARDPQWLADPSHGKLREPMIRYTHVLKALQAYNESNNYPNLPMYVFEEVRQLPLLAPSVFNFFLPDYQPNGPVAQANLVAPEFQLHNTATSIAYFNLVDTWVNDQYLMETGEIYEILEQEVPDSVIVRFREDSAWLEPKPEVILDELSLLLCHDQLSAPSREAILKAMRDFSTEDENLMERLALAVYLILVSPDYNVIR